MNNNNNNYLKKKNKILNENNSPFVARPLIMNKNLKHTFEPFTLQRTLSTPPQFLSLSNKQHPKKKPIIKKDLKITKYFGFTGS